MKVTQRIYTIQKEKDIRHLHNTNMKGHEKIDTKKSKRHKKVD